MKIIAAVSAISLATAAPALAHENWNHWNGGGWHHPHGGGSGWVAPFFGALAGTAIIGSVLAAPYYGYRGYGYAPYYSYPTPLVPPPPRWCPNP